MFFIDHATQYEGRTLNRQQSTLNNAESTSNTSDLHLLENLRSNQLRLDGFLFFKQMLLTKKMNRYQKDVFPSVVWVRSTPESSTIDFHP
jgi:hypothetical protein